MAIFREWRLEFSHGVVYFPMPHNGFTRVSLLNSMLLFHDKFFKLQNDLENWKWLENDRIPIIIWPNLQDEDEEEEPGMV